MTMRWAMMGLAAVGLSMGARADVATQGRDILEKNKDAIVTVQMTIKMRFSFGGSSDEQEVQQEATATIIDGSGLGVVALSQTDPASLFQSMMGMMGDNEMSSTLSDLKMLLEDGTEVPAEIVLRDRDFDLAFIRPKEKPAAPMSAVNLEDPGVPQILDEVIVLNRLGKVANRAHSAAVERIESVVERPRTFYIPGDDPTHSGLGSPAFTLDGKVAGILVLRTIKSDGGMGGMFGGESNVLGIIIPASDVLESAKQVPPADEVAAASS